jgi:cytochrome c556
MKQLFKWGVSGVLVAALFGVAYAQFAKPEEAIAYRQSVMILIGQHFGRIGAMVQGKKPFDPKEAQQNAALVATLSTLPLEALLTEGADKGKTHLKSSALKEKEAFKAAFDASAAETAKLAQTAASGDLEAIKAQFGAVAKTCKGCHEKYRTH